MQRWLAAGTKEIVVKSWLGDQGLGWFELYELEGQQWISLAHNPGVDNPFEKQLPPKTGWRDLSFKVINASHDSKNKPVFITVSQSGEVLQADDGIDPINGDSPPFTEVEFEESAKHNAPTYFYFSVLFK